MKHHNTATVPTVQQKRRIKRAGLNLPNWLVVSDAPKGLTVKHRLFDQTRRITFC